MKSRFITDPQDPSDSFLDTAGAEVCIGPPAPASRNGENQSGDGPVVISGTPVLTSEAALSSSAQSGATSAISMTSGGITINLLFDAAAMAAPASFRAGIQQAAALLTAAISDKITVNINIDYSGIGGGAAAGPDNGMYVSYSSVKTDLINNATLGDTTFNALPGGLSIQGQSSVAVWNAQLKLWGLLGANDTTTDDGSATFATDINSNLLVGVALHELTHAMGRVPYGQPYGSSPDIFDLFRFTSPSTQLIDGHNTATAAYFSVDGGNTKLADYGQNSDPSDFLNGGVQGFNDPFDEFYSGGTLQSLTAIDKEQLDALGFHTASAAVPTLSVHNDPTATGGQHVALSSLVTIADPSRVGYQKLELWDSNGTVTGGQFVVGGVAQTGGHEIDVAPANVASTVFSAGTAGGDDTLWARLLLNDGTLTAWQQFDVTVPQPTVTVHSDPTATGGQHVALSSLVTIDGVGYQTLELWDSNGTPAGGQFVVNGVAQTGGHKIDVAPADMAYTVFTTGTMGGDDTLWARLILNDGTLTAWQQFDVTVPAPTLAVHNDPNAIGGQHVLLSSLVTIADPGGDGYQQLELWDSNGTPAGGQFVVNGVPQTGGHKIDVAPADVAHTVFNTGTMSGDDTLWARLILNDGTLSAWQQFDVTVPAPTLSVHDDPTAPAGHAVALSSLVTIADPGGDGYQKLQLWDSNGTVAGGHFVVGGVAQTGGHAIDVTPANVSSTEFDAGTSSGSDALWARLQLNDGTLSAWQQFGVTVPSATAPSQVATNQSSAPGPGGDTFIFHRGADAAATPQPAPMTIAATGNDGFVFGADANVNTYNAPPIERGGFPPLGNGSDLASLLQDAKSFAWADAGIGGHDTAMGLENHDTLAINALHVAALHAYGLLIY